MAFTFNGSTKIIQCATGTTSFTVPDIYSRWKEWVADSTNSAFLPAFKPVGGDEIDSAAGTSIPLYAFLINGWRVRPQEANHTLTVTGGVLLVDGGGDPFANTIGAFRVAIRYSQPAQAITVATGASSGNSGSNLTAEQVRIEMDANSALLATISGGVSAVSASLTLVSDKIDTVEADVTGIGVNLGGLVTKVDEINPALSDISNNVLSIQNGLTATQSTMLLEMYQLLGLDPTIPLVVTQTQRTAGSIEQTIDSTATQTIVQRL